MPRRAPPAPPARSAAAAPGPAHSRTRTLAGLAAVVLLAAGLRIWDLTGKELWVDEANTVLIAREPPAAQIARLQLDSSPPLYYFLLHGWMRPFGDGEVAVRSLSAACGVALAAAVFLVGRALYGVEPGFVAGLLLAGAPAQILYSQQARMYALLPLAALVSMYCLWRAGQDRRLRWVVAYGLVTLAGLYTHNYMLFMLPAHLVMLAWSGQLRARPGTWLLCGAGIAAGYLPWVPSFVMQLRNPTHYGWFIPFWEQWGPLGALGRAYDSFAGGRFSLAYIWFGGREPTWTVFLRWALFGGLLLLGVLRLAQRRAGRLRLDARTGLLLTYLLVPPGASLASSVISQPNFVPGRCDQLFFPAFVLLVAAGLMRLRPAGLRWALAAGLLALSLAGHPGWDAGRRRDGERAIARAIAERARPGDAVVCTSLIRAAVQYYLEQAAAPVEILSYPADTARHLGNQDSRRLMRDPQRLADEVLELKERLRATGGREARFFAVLVSDPVNTLLRDRLLEPPASVLIEHVGEYRQAVVRLPVRVTLHRLSEPMPRPAGGAP